MSPADGIRDAARVLKIGGVDGMMWRGLRHKFNAVRTEVDGHKFRSKLEARCYGELKLKQSAGEILFFLREVPFRFISGIRYMLDFMVFNVDGSVRCIECKGMETDSWKLKAKLMAAEFPMVPLEIYR